MGSDRFRFRITDVNSRHIHFTVFANGVQAGSLVLTQDEFISLAAAMMDRGANQGCFEIVPLASDSPIASGDRPGGTRRDGRTTDGRCRGSGPRGSGQ